MSGPSVPSWVRHPCLLAETVQPSVIRSILVLNRDLPQHTPWHTGIMTMAGRANVLLGDIREKPWQAASVEEYLSKLHAVFLPHVVEGLAKLVVDSDSEGATTSAARGAEEKPYCAVAFTEQILVLVLNRVEERNARQIRQLRRMHETYRLPARLQYRAVPEWVKNPALLYPDCRGFTVKLLKKINRDMPANSDWWRDEFLSAADRARVITKRVKRFFNWHIGMPDDDNPLPTLDFQDPLDLSIDNAGADTWAASPHKTASLVGSVFRRHIAVEIKDEAMKFDYTLPGLLAKDR
ncbi:hypothetical protein SLS62_000944 [Diatrype stigma]|uniref:Uncharacterized protein n=1 Tax=Diatrype stigma TaxID=117547 RepID=A0AAN9UYZ9_9PEZI